MSALTIGRLARRAGLSRTALLYYEAEGLLAPASRSAAGYRLYGEREVERLRLVRVYREAGLPVETIRALLMHEVSSPAELLRQRLLALNDQVDRLRDQQRTLARLLAQPELLAASGVRSRQHWVELLRQAGLDDADMRRWHVAFEAQSAADHQRFLEMLGIDAADVAAIRAAAKVSA